MAVMAAGYDAQGVAVGAWILVGFALGAAVHALAPGKLPFGWSGALVAGALGALVGATGESLIEGRSRFELEPASLAGAAVGAAVLLVLVARAGAADSGEGRWSDAL